MTPFNKTRVIGLSVPTLALAIGLTIACDSTAGSTSTSPSSNGSGTSNNGGLGTLDVRLKDSPFSDAKALLVTFSEVSVHLSGGPFVSLPFAGAVLSRTCDLKKLETAQDVLGTGPLAAGHYTQIRLTVSAASIYFDNASPGPACAPVIAAPAGRTADVNIPSGQLILNRQFDLVDGTTTTLLLDFDGDGSVKLLGNGKYQMSPVIAVVSGGS